MNLIEPYARRPVRCIDAWHLDGWRLKVYGISYGRPHPRLELVNAARKQAHSIYPQPALSANRYGCGFIGVHDGRDANFLFYCWWENENELRHRVFSGPSTQFDDLPEQPADGIRACTWDLAVLAHERSAWVRHVLDNDDGPNLEGYFGDLLDANL